MSSSSCPPNEARRSARRLSRGKKLIFAAVTIVGFFAALELALAALGVRASRELRDPFVGFEPGSPLFVRQGEDYVTNPLKLSYFNPQRFPAEKSPQAVRVFCLGGSTTYGHPYDHRTYFGSWLSAYLREAAPQRDWQVINCGGISYASYRITRLMDELATLQPDVFVIYTGHNEFLEERTYRDIRHQHPGIKQLVRWATYSRTYSLIESALRRAPPEPKQQLSSEVNTILEVVGPDAYHRDLPLREGVLEHFRLSLTRMAQIARQAGARIIFIQPAANLKDFTPFKSEHSDCGPDQLKAWEARIAAGQAATEAGQHQRAAALFQDAATIDPHQALGLWYLGDALLAAGREREALDYFTRAKDEDVCPLRALSDIRQIITEVARDQGATLVDFPELLTEKYGRLPAVGLDSFLDHVHPTLERHGDLGWALALRFHDLGLVDSLRDSPGLQTQVHRAVLGQLSPQDHVMALNTLAMTLSWAGKVQEALRLAEAAVKQLPDDPEVASQYGRLLEKAGRDDEALRIYEQAIQRDSQDSMTLARLGGLYGRRGDLQQARDYLRKAIDNTPERAPLAFRVKIRIQLGDCLKALGDKKAAQEQYRQAAALDPQASGLQERLE